MKKILIATDFSNNAKNATDYAIHLFGTVDVQYTLMSAYIDPATTANVVVSLTRQLHEDAMNRLTEERASLLERHGNLNIAVRAVYGSVADQINHMCNNEAYDYVIVGSHGMSALETFVMGSNTLNVVKYVKNPMIVVPDNWKSKTVSKVVLAADLHHIKSEQLMDPIANVVRQYDAELMIVNIRTTDTDPDYNESVEGFELHNAIQDVNHSFHTHHHTDIAEGIVEFRKANQGDMLALVARHHSFFENLFHKSVTKELAKIAEVPLLIVHED